ncbi:hypothetical protein VVR12_00310 [Rothia sp. LK2588]|uniref:hypothetical protein n=1 Tax=Rothia sp. LK2588 TaxID=3114369 RepID=UPI0034CFDC1F
MAEYIAPTEDDPDALNLDGFDEEIRQESARVAHPVPHASFLTALRNFYGQYWLTRGSSSSSEFGWGVGWAVLSTLALTLLTMWMHDVVLTGGDAVSSLFRVLYMLMVWVAPGWLMVHIGPTVSLIKRYRNGRPARTRK